LPIVTFSKTSERFAAGYTDGTISVWNVAGTAVEKGKPWLDWDGNRHAIVDIKFSPDSERLLITSADGTAVVRSLADPKRQPTVLIRGVPRIVDLAFAADGNTIVTVDEVGTIRRWDRAKRAITGEIALDRPISDGSQYGSRSNWISVDATASRVATVAFDGSVHVVNLDAGLVLQEIPVPDLDKFDPTVYSLALSPDGKRLAVGGADERRRIRIYGIADQPVPGPAKEQARGQLKHKRNVYYVTFSADGKWLATASADQTVKVWSVGAWEKPPIVLRGHTGNVTRAEFDDTGNVLATVSADRTVRVWKLDTLTIERVEGVEELQSRQIFSFSQQDTTPFHVACGPDHRLAIMMTASAGGISERRVATYLFDPDKLTDLAQKRLPRELTEDEKRKYLRQLEPVSH
jgi:WD40 repeat protein